MRENKIHVYIAEPLGSKIFLTRKFKMQIIFTTKIFQSTVIYIHAYTHTCTHFIMVTSNFVLLLCPVLKNNITISLTYTNYFLIVSFKWYYNYDNNSFPCFILLKLICYNNAKKIHYIISRGICRLRLSHSKQTS